MNIGVVKLVLCAALVGMSLGGMAGEVQIGTLPDAGFLDTEASTNVAFNVWRNDVREFGVRLDFVGSVSNNVQVAFGRDANGDGELAAEETALVLGWRAGNYFVEDVTRGERVYESASTLAGDERFLQLAVRNDGAFRPRRVTLTCETGQCFTTLLMRDLSILFNREWNLFKVTRRGCASADEFCRIRNDYRFFQILVR